MISMVLQTKDNKRVQLKTSFKVMGNGRTIKQKEIGFQQEKGVIEVLKIICAEEFNLIKVQVQIINNMRIMRIMKLRKMFSEEIASNFKGNW